MNVTHGARHNSLTAAKLGSGTFVGLTRTAAVSGAPPLKKQNVARLSGSSECTSFAERVGTKREDYCLLWEWRNSQTRKNNMSMTKPLQEILFGKSLLWIKRRRSFNLYCSCIGHLRMVNFPPTIGRHKVTATKRRASYEFCHPIIPTFSIHSLKKSTRYFRTVLQHAFSTCLEALPFRGRRP